MNFFKWKFSFISFDIADLHKCKHLKMRLQTRQIYNIPLKPLDIGLKLSRPNICIHNLPIFISDWCALGPADLANVFDRQGVWWHRIRQTPSNPYPTQYTKISRAGGKICSWKKLKNKGNIQPSTINSRSEKGCGKVETKRRHSWTGITVQPTSVLTIIRVGFVVHLRSRGNWGLNQRKGLFHSLYAHFWPKSVQTWSQIKL